MHRVLGTATIGMARRSLAARRGRIDALPAFVPASSGAEGEQFMNHGLPVPGSKLGATPWIGFARHGRLTAEWRQQPRCA